ncbi:MAG: roadblock/LC7 domain-containing protein [Candidatus Helarchaeota archaeon]
MSLTKEQADKLTTLLNKLEARTELEACAVVTREGLRIACAVAAEMDADVYSAASAALVNLGETTLAQLKHGNLKEIIVRGDEGYTILTQAGNQYMVVGSCKKLSRMGYYLALLHRFSNKVAATLGVSQPIAEVPEAVPAAQAVVEEQVIPEPVVAPEAAPIEPPSPVPEVSFEVPSQPAPIPEPATADVGFDKSALFEALQTLGTEPETAQPASTESGVEIDTTALIDALKPKTAGIPAPVEAAPPVSQPRPTPQHDDDELFKISDKEAVLEALKVLGWEEPNE